MNNPSGITPLDVKVLVRPDLPEEKTKGGIILADVTKDKTKYAATEAVLIAAGPNAFKEWGNGAGPQVGDRVLFAQYSGARHPGADGVDYIVMNDEDIICKLEKKHV